jgi:competence protein ComEC
MFSLQHSVRRRLLLLLLVVLGAMVWLSVVLHRRLTAFTPWLAVLDVGQGDAILFSCHAGEQWLVDGGPDGTVLTRLGELLPPWDRSIEWLVLTHPHADHVSGLVDVLERYQVEHVLIEPSFYHTPASDALREAIEREGAAVEAPTHVWQQGCVQALTDPNPSLDDPNEQSLVLRVRIGSVAWLLMGDATESVEQTLLMRGVEPAYGLKVGHHGSRDSTSSAWLAAVRPSVAVISSGVQNAYGHPHAETLDRLVQSGAQVWRTDQQGTALFSWFHGAMQAERIDRLFFPWWLHRIKNTLRE